MLGQCRFHHYPSAIGRWWARSSLIEDISAVALVVRLFAYEELRMLAKSRSKNSSNIEILISNDMHQLCFQTESTSSKHPSVKEAYTLELQRPISIQISPKQRYIAHSRCWIWKLRVIQRIKDSIVMNLYQRYRKCPSEHDVSQIISFWSKSTEYIEIILHEAVATIVKIRF